MLTFKYEATMFMKICFSATLVDVKFKTASEIKLKHIGKSLNYKAYMHPVFKQLWHYQEYIFKICIKVIFIIILQRHANEKEL